MNTTLRIRSSRQSSTFLRHSISTLLGKRNLRQDSTILRTTPMSLRGSALCTMVAASFNSTSHRCPMIKVSAIKTPPYISTPPFHDSGARMLGDLCKIHLPVVLSRIGRMRFRWSGIMCERKLDIGDVSVLEQLRNYISYINLIVVMNRIPAIIRLFREPSGSTRSSTSITSAMLTSKGSDTHRESLVIFAVKKQRPQRRPLAQ